MPFKQDFTNTTLSEDYLKSVSESELKDRAYTPYLLHKYDRDSLEDIKKCLKQNKYTDPARVKESLGFIEELATRITIAIANEKKENKATWELESDLNDIKKIFDQLKLVMDKLEQQGFAHDHNAHPRPKILK